MLTRNLWLSILATHLTWTGLFLVISGGMQMCMVNENVPRKQKRGYNCAQLYDQGLFYM